MKAPAIRISLKFASNTPDNSLITFSRNVRALLHTVPGFTGIPVTAAALLAATDAFADAKAARAHGGKASTAKKNNKRDELPGLLKKLALFVQEASNNNLATLLSSGFDAVSTSRARYPLVKPAIIRVAAGMTG